jgi:hypothetical protein
MLKFLVQTFYQPLFSHAFPFSNFPAILFPSKSFPHQKSQSKGIKTKPKPKPKKPSKEKASGKNQKPQAKIKKPPALLQDFYKQWQTGWSKGFWGGV